MGLILKMEGRLPCLPHPGHPFILLILRKIIKGLQRAGAFQG